MRYNMNNKWFKGFLFGVLTTITVLILLVR